MPKDEELVTQEEIETRIYEIRGKKIILDSDLAEIYGVSTKVLNQAVRRNKKRFPKDFSFITTPQEVRVIRSQFVTGSQSHRNPRYRHSNTGWRCIWLRQQAKKSGAFRTTLTQY